MVLYSNKIYVKVLNEKDKWYVLYKSKHLFPIGNIHLQAEVYNCFFDETESIQQRFLVNQKHMHVPLSIKYRIGMHKLQNKKAILNDMLSIFSKSLETINAEQVCIYPSSIYVKDTEKIRYLLEQRCNEKNDEYDIREYRAGDSLKDVHHKISFKMAKLMVKEKLKINKDKIDVLLDLSGDEKDCVKVFSYFHCFAQYAQFYDETCIIHWYEKDVLHKEEMKTMVDEERIVAKIISMPKATISEPTSDMWVIDPSGLSVGDRYE